MALIKAAFAYLPSIIVQINFSEINSRIRSLKFRTACAWLNLLLLPWRFYQRNLLAKLGDASGALYMRCSACCHLCYWMSEMTSRLSPFFIKA